MGEVVTHRNVPLDATSRAILGALADSGARASARQLQLAAGLADEHQARYRIDQFLIPAGLAEPLTTDEDGETVYALTDEGRRFLHDRDDVETTTNVTVAPETDDSAPSHHGIDNPMELLAEHEETINSFGSRITRLEGRVNDLERALDGATDRVDENREVIQKIADRSEDIAEGLADLEKKLQQTAKENERERELVVQRIKDAMDDREEAFRNEMRRIREELKDVEEEANERRLF